MKISLKTFLPRTLLGRSLMILVTPVLLIQIIATIVFFDRHWSKMTDQLAFAVAGEIAAIADEISQDGDHPERLKGISSYAAKNLNLLVSFSKDETLSAELMHQAESRRSIVARTLDRALERQVRLPHTVDVDIHEKWVEVGVQLNKGVLHVSFLQRRLISSSGYIFLLWMIGSSIVLLAVATLFMRNQIRPIRRLAVVAERFGRGLEIPASFKPEGAYEVRQAARAFLDMHERIRRQIHQRTAMLAGVSHDLRTPLTRMKLQIEIMEPSPDTQAMRGDIADMERMIDAYLDFARGEGGEQAVRTDLREMIQRVAGNAEREGASVTVSLPDDLVLLIRPVAFERCLNNLVGNACKYARHTWIEARHKEDKALIIVDDDGPGIPEDLRDEVFKPFVRGEPSRNQATGGVGLGLPIVQDIVHGHGGKIHLEQSPRGGLRVVIQLPA